MSGLMDWVDERTGLRKLIREGLEESVPGGARARYVFGSVLTYLFMQQVVLGILLASYYSPSASDAWASTALRSFSPCLAEASANMSMRASWSMPDLIICRSLLSRRCRGPTARR